jgi:DNA-binding CsgD family transcriptional regulator
MRPDSTRLTAEPVNRPSLLFNIHYSSKTEPTYANELPAELSASANAVRIMNYLCEQDQFVKKHYTEFKSLTKREREIIKLIVDGQSSFCISERLFISVHTVNNHRKNICKKLDVKSLSELIKFAIAFFII